MRHSLACLTACIVLYASAATFGQEVDQVPKDIQKKLDYFDGQWTGKWTYTTGETENEFFTRKPILGGRFAVLTGRVGEQEFHLVSGWDAESKTITDVIFGSDGMRWIEKWKIEDDCEWFKLESNSTGITGDGKKTSSQTSVRILNKDQYTYEAKNVQAGGEPQPGFKAVITRKRGQAQDEATKEHLIGLGDRLVGHWISEFEVEIDVEGVCVVGDVISESRSYEWVSNKTAILGKRVYKIDGKTIAEGVALIAWDAPKKQIKSAYVDSLGGSWQSVWRKRGKRFAVQDRGTFGDGRKSVGRNVLSFSDDGNTLTFKLSGQALGDQTFPDKELTHRRVQK